jgi:hypothetical protein
MYSTSATVFGDCCDCVSVVTSVDACPDIVFSSFGLIWNKNALSSLKSVFIIG